MIKVALEKFKLDLEESVELYTEICVEDEDLQNLTETACYD